MKNVALLLGSAAITRFGERRPSVTRMQVTNEEYGRIV